MLAALGELFAAASEALVAEGGAGAAVKQLVQGVPASILGATAHSLFSPVTRAPTYLGNIALANAVPGPESTFQALIKGFLTEDQAKWLLKHHGIDFPGSKFEQSNNWEWNRIFWSMTSQLDVSQLNVALGMGWIDINTWQKRLRALGIWDQGVANLVTLLRQQIYGVSTVRDLVNRGFMDEQTAHKHLNAGGIIDKTDRDNLLSMRVPLPGMGEALQFATKYVDDEVVAIANGLDTELDKLFSGPVGAWLSARGVSEQHRKYLWRAHWQTPSMGQLMEMVRRFRPGKRLAMYQAVVPNVRSITLDEVRSAAVRNGIAPAWVDNLSALSYNVLSVRQMRLLLEENVWTADDVNEALLDQGYTPEQAKQYATALDRKVRRPVLDPILRVARGKISEGYRLGAIDQGQAIDLLKQYGLRDAEVQTAIAAMDVEEAIDTAREVIAAVKRMRMAGVYSMTDAKNQLVGLGIVAEKADKYVRIWEVQLQAGRAQVGAGKLVDWLKRGLITTDVLIQRLQNLGFADQDIRNYLLAAAQDLTVQQLKAVEAAAKTREQQARAAAAAERAARQQHQQAVAALARHGSPGQIARWVAKGLLTYDEGVARLEALDWPLEDAMREIDAALAAVKPPKPPKPPSKPHGQKTT